MRHEVLAVVTVRIVVWACNAFCNSKDGCQCLRWIYRFYLVKTGTADSMKMLFPVYRWMFSWYVFWLKRKTFQKLAVLVTLGKAKIQLVWNIFSGRTEAIFGFYLIVEAKPTSKTFCFWLEICWWERLHVSYCFFLMSQIAWRYDMSKKRSQARC